MRGLELSKARSALGRFRGLKPALLAPEKANFPSTCNMRFSGSIEYRRERRAPARVTG